MIPRVVSKQPGPQPQSKISHYDCAGVNCKQKKAWGPFDGDAGSADLFRGARGKALNGKIPRAYL